MSLPSWWKILLFISLQWLKRCQSSSGTILGFNGGLKSAPALPSPTVFLSRPPALFFLFLSHPIYSHALLQFHLGQLLFKESVIRASPNLFSYGCGLTIGHLRKCSGFNELGQCESDSKCFQRWRGVFLIKYYSIKND